MAYVPTVSASRDAALTKTSQPPKRGLFRKILDAVIATQRRRAEYEIARYLRARGGTFNDDAEREIESRFLLPRRDNAQVQGR